MEKRAARWEAFNRLFKAMVAAAFLITINPDVEGFALYIFIVGVYLYILHPVMRADDMEKLETKDDTSQET